jgi:hypothetical protein
MVLFATKSYYWVETPFRKKTFKSRAVLLVLTAICVGIATGALLAGSRTFRGILYVGKYPYLDLVTGSRDSTNHRYSGRNCNTKNYSTVLPWNCEIKGTRDKAIYFVGDSHTSHYRETHFLLNRELGLSIDGISINGCSFPSAPSDLSTCGSSQQKQEKRVIAALKAGDIVAISNRYSINAPGIDQGYWMKTPSSVHSLNNFARRVFDKGGKIVLFGPLPEFQLPSEICTPVWFRPLPHAECEVSLEQIQEARATQVRLMKSIDTRILVYAPMESICQDGKCTLIDAGNKPLFVDDDHLTDYANHQYIFPSFKKFLYTNGLV